MDGLEEGAVPQEDLSELLPVDGDVQSFSHPNVIEGVVGVVVLPVARVPVRDRFGEEEGEDEEVGHAGEGASDALEARGGGALHEQGGDASYVGLSGDQHSLSSGRFRHVEEINLSELRYLPPVVVTWILETLHEETLAYAEIDEGKGPVPMGLSE